MSNDPAADSSSEHSSHERESGDGFAVMPFEQQRRVHELLSQETRYHIIQTILGHPAFLPSITEFDYYISKSKPTIHEQLDRLQDEGLIRAYELGREQRKRDLPYRFYGLTEHGVEVLYEYKYLRGVPIMRAITDATEKPAKVERHQNAPRPKLPDPVADALQYDEPDLEDIDIENIDELEPRELVVEGAHRRDEHVQDVQGTERNQNETPEQDTGPLDDLFQSET
jgi:DNA-binding transcriptional ArsR family regulator